jgi:protein-arginine kinase activator protein McsA
MTLLDYLIPPLIGKVPCPRCGTRLNYRRARRRFECNECWLFFTAQAGRIVQGHP